MIALFAALGYLAASIVTMRLVYVRLRNHEIEENAKQYAMLQQEFGMEARLFNGFIATLVGMLWPIMALILAITHKPPKSATELKREAKERERRIAELERELGMR